MKASAEWLESTGAVYWPEAGRTGTAHLSRYPARFAERGSGSPLILVHGLAGGMDLLGPVAEELARDFRVITYQLRGEDEWSDLRRSFGIPDLADDLIELADYLSLERPAVLGVSFGGVVALEAAIRRPGHFRSLALQGVGPRFEPGLLQEAMGLVLARYPLPTESPFVNQFFNLFFGRRQAAGSLCDFVTRQCRQTDQGVMAHRFGLVERVEFIPRVNAVRCPVTLMAGERDVLVSKAGLSELASAMPRGTGRLLQGAGHLAFTTHARVVADEARKALAGS